MHGGFDRKPGGSSLAQDSELHDAATPAGKHTLTETESPLAGAIDTGHDPDRSSEPVSAQAGDPAGHSPAVPRTVLTDVAPAAARKGAPAAGKTDARSIVRKYVVEHDATREVPDPSSDVYKASQDLSRATCGNDGEPPGMVSIQGHKIHHDVEEPLTQMLAAAAKETGQKNAVKIRDALRSLPQQWDMWKHRGLFGLNGGSAAIPGTSNHGTGRAVDLSGDLGWVAKHAGEFGFVNFPGEDWHFDHLSSAGVRGRKFKEGASRKHSGHGSSKMTKDEAATLQAGYDASVAAYDEGKAPAGAPSSPAPIATATTAPAADARLAQLVGTSVMDDGGFTFVLEPDLSFKVTSAPLAQARSLGKRIKRDDPKLARSWQALAAKLQHEHPPPSPPPAGR